MSEATASEPTERTPLGRIRAALESARARVVALTVRASPSEAQRLFGLTLGLGAVCGVVAVAFHLAIQGAQSILFDAVPRDTGWQWVAWVVLLPAGGGLVAGVILDRFAPHARGSGIPQVKAAYALDVSGGMRLRDAFAKFVVCVVQLGTGASLGREGPTVQICAAVATSIGRWLALSPANLRRLIPVGAAAGVAAAFNAPIAAVTFTIEEVVGTLDGTVLSGVVVAAALAAVVEHSILGGHPVLAAPLGAGLHHPSSLLFYALLGIAAGLVSIGFTDLLLSTRANFRQSKLPAWARPAIGGLLTGALAAIGIALVGEDGVAGGGYATLSRALRGDLVLHALALLCVLKLVATVTSYSSGGAGGIFAPVLFVGAMLGGLVGQADVWALGHDASAELSSFALVGMGAVFAGVVRAPMTSVLIVFEMTGGYDLVLPLMIANVTAYALARRARPTPIYEALLAQDGIRLPHGSTAKGALARLTVAEAMVRDVITLPASTPITEGARRAREHGHAAYPVLDDDGRFVGLLSEARMQRTIAEGGAERTVGQVARRKEHAWPDEPVLRAVARMQRLGVRQLPVLAREHGALVGILAMSDVLRAQVRSEVGDGDTSSADRASFAEVAALDPTLPIRREPGDEQT